MDSGNPTDVDKLNPKWAYEPFTVVSAWDGEIGLYNTHHKRFMRMEPGDMGISHDVAIDALSPRLKTVGWYSNPKLVMTKAEADKAAIASGAEAKAKAEAEAVTRRRCRSLGDHAAGQHHRPAQHRPEPLRSHERAQRQDGLHRERLRQATRRLGMGEVRRRRCWSRTNRVTQHQDQSVLQNVEI